SLPLEHLGCDVGQPGAFAATQGEVRGVFPVLETVYRISQAGCGFGEVGRIDLFDVAETDDLRAGTGAGDQGLHLLGRQVLRLVDDNVAVEEGASAHEVHGPDLDARGEQVVGRRASPGAAFLRRRQHFQVV